MAVGDRHVLFISVTGDYYGAPRSMHLLADGLIRSGFRVEVAICAPGELGERLTAAGVPFFVSPTDPYFVPPSITSGLRKLWRRLYWSVWLFALIRRRRPKVIYLNTLRGASAAIVARASGASLVWHLRGLETGTGSATLRALRLRCVSTLATRVVAVSDATAQPLAALGYDQGRITVAYNGIDVPAMRQEAHRHTVNARQVAGAAPGEIVIAYAGRLDRHKGVLDFIEAARRYTEGRQDARFLLIGGPVGSTNPDWTAIAAAIEDAPEVRNRLVVTGFRHDVLALLDTCDVVTLPSHAEGFPRAVLEAMALGKPLVATSVGGIPEALADGQHGLLIPPRDPAAIARAWERLADDAALRERLGGAAFERVSTEFTIDATTKAVVGMLEALLSN